MRSTIEIVKCDLNNCGSEKEVKLTNLNVVFTTEQTEGRPIKPHLTNESLDICNKCMDRVLKGEMIFANGAQGHNNYYFKDKT